MGHKVMTYELTASKRERLPVSSVGHCCVRPTLTVGRLQLFTDVPRQSLFLQRIKSDRLLLCTFEFLYVPL